LEGKAIEDVIPEYLQDDWSDVTERIAAFKRSLRLAKVSRSENCFFDLVPSRFLSEWCEVKNQITGHVLETVPRPERYDFYKHVAMLIGDIATQEVKFDRRFITSFVGHNKLGNYASKMLAVNPRVCYNQFGTKTGRLTTKKNTLPILTLPKSFKKAITPQNDYFLEIDFNGAEVRTLLGILEKQQPAGDIHEFHLHHVFSNFDSRSQAKEAFFAWLYGAKKAVNIQQQHQLDAYYQKEHVLQKYYQGGRVTTPYGKTIMNVDAHHALNYIIQSTTAELCLKQFLKVNYLLSRTASSRVSFLVHDAIVLDMSHEDETVIPDIIDLMRSTNFGNFAVNIKKGKNLGEMLQWIR
tara:strand:+ start:1250 stop:2305 length:1056 start_codon:yes stop_codon:yes gene_type:complete